MEASAPPAQDAGGKVDKSVVPIKLKGTNRNAYWRGYLVDPSLEDIRKFIKERMYVNNAYFTYIDADQDAIIVGNVDDWATCLTYWRRYGAATLCLSVEA